jgi:hypothetical protein
MPNVYDVGDLVTVSAPFADSVGVGVDPTTVICQYLKPGGTANITLTYGVDATVIRDSAGNYHVDIDADTSGSWYYGWHSRGTGQAAAEGWFVVREKNLL